MADFVRARSNEQKEERMAEIKRAADAQFAVRIYPEITLSTIAEELSWSRANLYKYVTSKEEIFLELCWDKWEEYFTALKAAFPGGCGYSPAVFAEVWAGILNAHPEHLKFSSILSSIIETNVTVERLALFKKKLHDQIDEISRLLSQNFDFPEKAAYWLFMSVHYHAVGVYGYCNAGSLVIRALEMAEVKLEKPDFRLEMKRFILMNLRDILKERM